jgi:hypothetical protein
MSSSLLAKTNYHSTQESLYFLRPNQLSLYRHSERPQDPEIKITSFKKVLKPKQF